MLHRLCYKFLFDLFLAFKIHVVRVIGMSVHVAVKFFNSFFLKIAGEYILNAEKCRHDKCTITVD